MVNSNISEVIKLFNEVKKATNNFKEINEDYLKTNPKCLKVFRILRGIKQEDFKKNVDPSISDYECGRIKQIRNHTKLKKLMAFIQETIETINRSGDVDKLFFTNLEKIFFPQKSEEVKNKIRKSIINYISSNNYREILEKAAGREIVREDEKKVIEYLKNSGISESDIEVHKYVGKINVDIFIPKKKIAILVTSTSSTKYSHRYAIIERVALRGFRLKKLYPEITSVLVLFSNLPITPYQQELLKDAFDFIFINDLSALALQVARWG
jgi:hypothetical protein